MNLIASSVEVKEWDWAVPEFFQGPFSPGFSRVFSGRLPGGGRKAAAASPACPVSATGIRGATVTILTSGRRSLLRPVGFGGPDRYERFFVPRSLW